MDQSSEFPPIQSILNRLGIRLDKRRSQHFLRDQGICAAIADLAELTPEHTAIEVGTGLGNLTVELAKRAGTVLSIEVDTSFQEWHKYLDTAYGPIDFINEDFTKLKLEELVAERGKGGPVVGVGNLPYQITSEILFRFVDSPIAFDSCVFMIQREVAERIAAGAGVRASGALTYKIALKYRAEIAMEIGPEEFIPPPRVHSSVLVLKPLPKPLVKDDAHRKRVYKMLDSVFRFRRKTLLNSLQMGQMVQSRDESASLLSRAEIDEKRRPENLTIDEFLRLDELLNER